MQNLTLKFGQNSIIILATRLFAWKIAEFELQESLIFLAKKMHTSAKAYSRFFFFCLDLNLLIPWNLYKADTNGANNVSALSRCPLYRDFF